MLELISLLMSPFVRFSKWFTYEVRVARAVSRQAEKRGLQLHPRTLRQHLYSVHFAQRLSDTSALPSLRASLDPFTQGTPVSSAELFDLIQQAITQRADPVAAANVVGATVRDRIDTLQGALETGDRDHTLWETRLAQLRPLRAQTARDIYASWPRIATVLRLLDGPNRAEQLDGWSKVSPSFLHDAPSEVWGWLADLAYDVGASHSSLQFINKSIELGAFPLGFWEIRRLQLEVELGIEEPNSPQDLEHPLVQIWNFEAAGDIDGARSQLTAWVPAIATEKAARTLMLASIALNDREYDRAIALALPLHEETGSSPAAIIAARAMVAQQTFASSDLYASRTADAFVLLISARDALRSWHEDTTNVVVLAATVARLLNDPTRAISLTQSAPEGEATAYEAADIKVRAALATMLAENGQLELARALLTEGALPASTASHLRALIALAEDDPEAAAQHFGEALDITSDFEEKGRFALQLAQLGQLHPFANDQRELGNEEFADHLTLISEAYGGIPGGMERLRAAAHTSAQLSLILSELYRSLGKPDLQLQVLAAAAERLDDADVWLTVARLEKQLEKTDEAIQSAQAALRSAPRTWGAFARAHGLLVELYSSLPDWDEAVKCAENLARLRPDDQFAVWTLITCQYYAGELDHAVRTWDTMATREHPKHRPHVMVWLGLYQQFGQLIGTIDDLVAISDQWADDEAIRRAIVGLILLPQLSDHSAAQRHGEGEASDEATVAEQTARSVLFDNYFRDFPDGGIRQLTVDPDDEHSLLDRIAEAVGQRPDTSELDNRVFSGYFPLGMICAAHGGTLAEAVVSHASGVRFASSQGHGLTNVAGLALGRQVVVDTTALFALTVLPAAVRVALMSSFAALVVSGDQFRDAVAGAQSVGRFGYAGPGVGRLGGAVSLRSRFEDERALDRGRIGALVELMRSLNRDGRSARIGGWDGDSSFGDDVWFAAAAVAGTTRSLWSDDAALNRIAAHFGVNAFSTPDLVTTLEANGELSTELARMARTHLIAERYISEPFDAEIFSAALNVRQGAAMNVASVIEHLDGSAADGILSFMLAHASSLTPEGSKLERWISACTRWLLKISPDAATTHTNLAIMAHQIVQANWLVPQTFPFIDAGMLDGLCGTSTQDPLVDAIERKFRLKAQQDRTLAAHWVFDLISGLRQEDRPRYTAIVLKW